MAPTAEGDEILFHILSQQASQLNVMDLQILGTSASLASPTIALEHLLAEPPIVIPIQAKPALSWDAKIHDAFGIRSKNSCRCAFGSSRYIRLSAKSRQSELPETSRFAPARKSAQIISRQ
jgi:hypothetical protein